MRPAFSPCRTSPIRSLCLKQPTPISNRDPFLSACSTSLLPHPPAVELGHRRGKKMAVPPHRPLHVPSQNPDPNPSQPRGQIGDDPHLPPPPFRIHTAAQTSGLCR